MGFEDNDENKGFEADQIDLDSDADLSMGTGRVKAQRKKGIKTEAPRFTKRDAFGRRSDGEEAGEGADMLNPDKPMKLSGGMSRHEAPIPSKPLNKDSSKFSYLFDGSSDGDEDDAPLLSGKARSIDALAINGDEDNADEVFSRGPRTIVEPQKRGSFNKAGKAAFLHDSPAAQPQEASAPAAQPEAADEPAPENPMTIEPRKRFSKREENGKKNRFTKRESEPVIPSPLSSGQSDEVAQEAAKALEAERAAMKNEGEKAAREAAEPEPAPEQPADSQSSYDSGYSEQIYYGQPQSYGYPPAPVGYGSSYPYSQPYPYQPPYGGYPYPPCPYPQYPQYPPYPQPYSQPQIIPAGYVYQAGFIPLENAAGAHKGMSHEDYQDKPFKRRKSSSGSRSAYRYDHEPEAEPVRIKARTQAKKSEPEPMIEIEPLPPRKPNEPLPSIKELQEAQTSQLERILAQIPPEEEPVHEAPAPVFTPEPVPEPPIYTAPEPVREAQNEEKTDDQPGQSASRFRNRHAAGSDEPAASADSPSPSRFSRRSSSSGGERPAERTAPSEDRSSFSPRSSAFDAPEAPSAPSGRFNKR